MGGVKNPGTVWTKRKPAAATEPPPEALVVVLRAGRVPAMNDWSPRKGHVVLEGDTGLSRRSVSSRAATGLTVSLP